MTSPQAGPGRGGRDRPLKVRRRHGGYSVYSCRVYGAALRQRPASDNTNIENGATQRCR